MRIHSHRYLRDIAIDDAAAYDVAVGCKSAVQVSLLYPLSLEVMQVRYHDCFLYPHPLLFGKEEKEKLVVNSDTLTTCHDHGHDKVDHLNWSSFD